MADELYKQAVEDIKNLVQDVREQCEEFADRYCYDKPWVLLRFREEFNKAIREDNV
ncbi:hypothetical protein [uncultured Clostridium sp.]|uniref:hypothetical protein n=1 Tax=uncultured Clostridium sp. TaxID=59620 RepID=UPI0027DCF1A2|nr:hypothetical protein [uncultured Clostridium sp.]